MAIERIRGSEWWMSDIYLIGAPINLINHLLNPETDLETNPLYEIIFTVL